MRAIFISYRRDDSEGQAGRLFDDLVRTFDQNSVFMDVADIEAGRDFRKVIDDSVATCGVLLAMIGREWLDAKDQAGKRRLDNPQDFVRLETASALKRDIPVIPVLVQGARMPDAEALPDDLKELAYRNGVELTHARWDSDVQVLINALRPHVEVAKGSAAPTAGSKPAPTHADNNPPKSKRALVLIAVAVIVVVAAIAGFIVWRRSSGEGLAAATMVPCANEGTIESPQSADKVTLEFSNQTEQPLNVFWLGWKGKRNLYENLAPGNSWTADTFAGHYWLVARPNGACYAIFEAGSSPTKADLLRDLSD